MLLVGRREEVQLRTLDATMSLRKLLRTALWLRVALRILSVAGAVCSLVGSATVAQQAAPVRGYEPPSIAALALSDVSQSAIRVDGILDEEAWQVARAAAGFRQREPIEGADASEPTEVRVIYDGTTLYVGVLAYDAQPDRVIARVLQRDRIMAAEQFTLRPRFTGDDAVAILLDPFHDHRNAVIFATNPNGAEFDALLADEGREFNVDWRGVWRVSARRTAEGWSAEFAIPFRSLRYPNTDADEPWGFNVYRVIRRKNEEVLWSAWSRENEGFHRVSRAGHLTGLVDLPRSGLNLEAKPYLLTGASQEQEIGGLDTDPEFKAGLDLKWEVRPGLVLDVTANTDFAQVEADSAQVNLTRFDLFFPEKRDFFLENSGVFEFGWRSFFEPPPFLMFFSRQIGFAEDGEVPVIGGARMSGRVGAQTVGLLDIVTDEATFPEEGTFEPRRNFAVARVQRDIGRGSYVGAMVADRRSTADWNTAGGVDFSAWPVAAVNVQGFAVGTLTSDDLGNDFAYRLATNYSGDRYGVNVGHLYVGPDATADMGFITRTDIRRTDGFLRVTPRPRFIGLRKVDIYAIGQHIVRRDWVLQDWQLGTAVNPEWGSGERLNLMAGRGFTRLDESFDIREDDDPAIAVTVPVGDYPWWQTGWFFNTSRARPVVFDSFGILWWVYGGHVHTLTGNVTLQPSANLSLALGYMRNSVSVPDGNFNADIGTARIGVALSTRLSVNALVQYNSLDNELSANVRLNFIHRPGSDLFIVFNETRGSAVSTWDVDNRTALVKVTYLARF